jgi:hypothetical protein
MIRSYQEAQFLYSMCESEQREMGTALQAAQVEVQRAIHKLQQARKKLTRAEFRAGKTRYMVKKSGFSEILRHEAHVRHRPIFKFHGMLFPSHYFESLLRSMLSDNRLTTIPGPHFTVILD